jgi:hypothetical protein
MTASRNSFSNNHPYADLLSSQDIGLNRARVLQEHFYQTGVDIDDCLRYIKTPIRRAIVQDVVGADPFHDHINVSFSQAGCRYPV